MRIREQTMVLLGKGLAIIGGYGNVNAQDKIHLLSCMNRNCSISTLSQELSVPREFFLAIPIPDTIAGCISGGKKSKKGAWYFYDSKAFSPKFFQTASWLLLLEMDTATTTPITCIVALMEETAADLAWIKSIALSVFARAVDQMWESQILWLETVFAMTWPTMTTAILMVEIAVGHA